MLVKYKFCLYIYIIDVYIEIVRMCIIDDVWFICKCILENLVWDYCDVLF